MSDQMENRVLDVLVMTALGIEVLNWVVEIIPYFPFRVILLFLCAFGGLALLVRSYREHRLMSPGTVYGLVALLPLVIHAVIWWKLQALKDAMVALPVQ